jgi:transposase-like protein
MGTTNSEARAAKEPRRGFSDVHCIRCGATDATRVNLEDLSFECSECGETYTTRDVHEHMDAWTRVIMWVGLAPTK